MQLVQNTLDRFVSSGQIAGYAARIMRSDEVLFEGHGGCANLEKKVPMADDTIFAIAPGIAMRGSLPTGINTGISLANPPMAIVADEWG